MALMRVSRRLFLAGLAASTARPATGATILPPPGVWSREVRAEGAVIGSLTHRFSFTKDSYRVELDAEMVGAGLDYEHHAVEDWRGGWLDHVEGETRVGERRYDLLFQRRDGSFWGDVNGVSYNVSGYVIPASFWHRDTVFVRGLWSAEDGLVKIFSMMPLGAREETLGGRLRRLTGYRLIGELNRDLWYDEDCVLWRQNFQHHQTLIEVVPGEEV